MYPFCQASDLAPLSGQIVSTVTSFPMQIPQSHPKEQQSRSIGGTRLAWQKGYIFTAKGIVARLLSTLHRERYKTPLAPALVIPDLHYVNRGGRVFHFQSDLDGIQSSVVLALHWPRRFLLLIGTLIWHLASWPLSAYLLAGPSSRGRTGNGPHHFYFPCAISFPTSYLTSVPVLTFHFSPFHTHPQNTLSRGTT
ncbi:hypothetical protein B0T20DRAFT_17726 [Sordaria brevicollis]|uniref:Uncharacterized protein n=1 Tax=Sordaria brevicollis TaxID=83679 RepID=A0AAE0UH72_SORBR|nr:hypothetical protein B0T20DRAFT_17726 [Sordaria brevicollis]